MRQHARSSTAYGILRLYTRHSERGIVLRSLREGIDTSNATGRMVIAVFPFAFIRRTRAASAAIMKRAE